VYDAAGNGLTILTRRLNVTGGTLQSSSAARFVPDGSANMTANYGRWVRIAGTLEANTGEPIVNAPVELALTSRAATRGKILKTIHTNSDGRYSLSVRAGASRTLTLRHEESGAALTGSLKVKSRISLRAASRRVKSLGTMRLTGRIPGERAKRGASVAIKVRNGRRWRTVAVVRTDRGGAFKFSYRFRRTRHAALRFRAVALRSSDLVVAATPSMSLKVRVG
jgi:hypothetical protein